jgi:hypothetical protein
LRHAVFISSDFGYSEKKELEGKSSGGGSGVVVPHY